MQLDFAMVALGFQKAGAQAKEGGAASKGGSQSMLETIIDDGMVKPNPLFMISHATLLLCLITAGAPTVGMVY